ncbi:MAG: hypothetical protein RL208_557, partial [Pseudomonadota bacterium]
VYSKPLNFSEQLLKNCEMELKKFRTMLEKQGDFNIEDLSFEEKMEVAQPLLNDLNTRAFGANLHRYCKEKNVKALYFGCKLVGLV